MLHPNKEIMERAIQSARNNHGLGHQHAIAAIIVKDDEIIAEAVTTVYEEQDATCHAEINTLRQAMTKLQSSKLPGCYLYTTYEPCPMCTSAAIWAKMAGIIYGASREDRNEKYPWRIMIPAAEVIKRGQPLLELHSDFMRKECKELLELE